MEIRNTQMAALEKAGLKQFAVELQQTLRAEAPRMSARLDDQALAQFCADTVSYSVQHGLAKKKHIAQMALCFLKLGGGFRPGPAAGLGLAAARGRQHVR
ncbi:hypothetical protein [Pseudoduganella sp. UC29_71]|uniref:hypothetical protein n=1 Tax=Pseudoduganella sp. UC29_71 TaxID=3350174 RepID=UPI0036704CD0